MDLTASPILRLGDENDSKRRLNRTRAACASVTWCTRTMTASANVARKPALEDVVVLCLIVGMANVAAAGI